MATVRLTVWKQVPARSNAAGWRALSGLLPDVVGKGTVGSPMFNGVGTVWGRNGVRPQAFVSRARAAGGRLTG